MLKNYQIMELKCQSSCFYFESPSLPHETLLAGNV